MKYIITDRSSQNYKDTNYVTECCQGDLGKNEECNIPDNFPPLSFLFPKKKKKKDSITSLSIYH